MGQPRTGFRLLPLNAAVALLAGAMGGCDSGAETAARRVEQLEWELQQLKKGAALAANAGERLDQLEQRAQAAAKERANREEAARQLQGLAERVEKLAQQVTAVEAAAGSRDKDAMERLVSVENDIKGFEKVLEQHSREIAAVIERLEVLDPEAASRACLSNAKQVGLACKLYSIDHAGRFPDSLQELVPDYLPDRATFASPLAPKGERQAADMDYEYFGKGLRDTDDPAKILLRGRYKDANGKRSVVRVDISGRLE